MRYEYNVTSITNPTGPNHPSLQLQQLNSFKPLKSSWQESYRIEPLVVLFIYARKPDFILSYTGSQRT